MLGFLAFVIGVLLVGGLLFLGASLLLGRGETQPRADLDRSPVELPDDRPVTGDDVRSLQISVAFRGYRMAEVDWLLDQFAQALDDRDRVIADLRSPPQSQPQPHPHPTPHPHPRPALTEKTTTEPAPIDPGTTDAAEQHAAPDAAPASEESSEAERRA